MFLLFNLFFSSVFDFLDINTQLWYMCKLFCYLFCQPVFVMNCAFFFYVHLCYFYIIIYLFGPFCCK